MANQQKSGTIIAVASVVLIGVAAFFIIKGFKETKKIKEDAAKDAVNGTDTTTPSQTPQSGIDKFLGTMGFKIAPLPTASEFKAGLSQAAADAKKSILTFHV